jgi:CheY-like chemotaxis protein
VDDDADVTFTLKTVLENNGYAVDVFNDPIIALENFKKAADDDITDGIGEGTYYYYDLVLTDIRMPTMNGFELYQKIILSYGIRCNTYCMAVQQHLFKV